MWYSNRILIVANGIFYISTAFTAIFPCSPREAFWNRLIKDVRCIKTNIHIIFLFSYNILSDIIILILPSKAVWKLKISTRKKTNIVLLFAIGLLWVGKTWYLFSNTRANNAFVHGRACIADGMVIFYVTHRIKRNADVSYNILFEGLWATVEIGFGIIVTCMFTLPKFIDAKGAKIQTLCLSLMRSVKSFTSGSSEYHTQSDTDMTASWEMKFNRVEIDDQATSDISSANCHQDLQSHPTREGSYDIDRGLGVKALDVQDKI